MGVACDFATSASDCSGSTRTSRPPSPLAAIAMLPPMRNARPPNIFCSVSPASPATRSRMRVASASSYDIGLLAHVKHEQLGCCRATYDDCLSCGEGNRRRGLWEVIHADRGHPRSALVPPDLLKPVLEDGDWVSVEGQQTLDFPTACDDDPCVGALDQELGVIRPSGAHHSAVFPVGNGKRDNRLRLRRVVEVRPVLGDEINL